MNKSLNDALRDIVDRHSRTLLDDNRRCESCLRDGAFAGREMAGLVAALKAGIPKRLVAIPAGSLTAKGMANFATELSKESGLSDEVARRSVEAWAYALRVDGSGKPAQSKEEGEKKKAEEQIATPKAPEKPSVFYAICGVLGLVVLVIVVGSLPQNQLELTIPGWIFVVVIFVKSVQSVINYIDWLMRQRRSGHSGAEKAP